MTKYTHHCATCDAPIVEPNEHCAKHPHSAIYMSVDIGAPRDACEVLADPPRLDLEPAVPDSVTSGDSTELDAIRGWINDDDVCHSPRTRDVMRFLLGHVDDMTAQLSRAMGRGHCDFYRAKDLEIERDELRAKLGVVDKDWMRLLKEKHELEAKLATVTQQLCDEARAHGETQAKLAEAEKQLSIVKESENESYANYLREKERADVAEAESVRLRKRIWPNGEG